MPSAFAMFASVSPSSAGAPTAAPNVQDDATTSLFSSKLSDAFQALTKTASRVADTPSSTQGRLSLTTISTTDLEAAQTGPILVEAEATSPDQSAPIDTPPIAVDEQTEETEPTAADLSQASSQPPVLAAPVVVPTTAPAASSDTVPADVGSEGSSATSAMGLEIAQPTDIQAPVPSIESGREQHQVEADAAAPVPASQTSSSSGDEAEQALAATSLAPHPAEAPQSNESTKALLTKPAADAPAPPVPTIAAVPQSSEVNAPVSSSLAASQTASPLPTPPIPTSAATAASSETNVAKTTLAENSAIRPASPPSTKAEPTAGLSEADLGIETSASSKAEIKVVLQQAAAPAVQTPQIIAGANLKLAVAEAIRAISAEEAAAEPVSDALPVPGDSSNEGATTSPKPDAPVRAAPLSAQQTPVWSGSVQTDHRSSMQNGSTSASTDRAELADAASTFDQTPSRTLGQTSTDSAAAPAGVQSSAVPPLNAPHTSPATAAPLDAPVEARALNSAASLSQATSASSLSHATIETTAQLAAQIARKMEGRSTRFDMVLTPEDLGRVDVSLEIGSDGQLAARLAFDNPAAATELRGRADELRRQLQEAGFQVSRDSLDFTQRDTSGGGFDRQQQQRQAPFAGGARLIEQADISTTPLQGGWNNQSQTRDRVDVRV
jgi:hypothetical protein